VFGEGWRIGGPKQRWNHRNRGGYAFKPVGDEKKENCTMTKSKGKGKLINSLSPESSSGLRNTTQTDGGREDNKDAGGEERPEMEKRCQIKQDKTKGGPMTWERVRRSNKSGRTVDWWP